MTQNAQAIERMRLAARAETDRKIDKVFGYIAMGILVLIGPVFWSTILIVSILGALGVIE